MQFEGNVNINASREKVWEFLTDPNFVSQCAPGLKEMQVVEPDKKFKAVASVGFGSIKTTFDNDVEFVSLTPPDQAEIKVHGKAPGSAVDALAVMKLSEGDAGTTNMHWSAEVTISGTIAALASRMMGAVTKKLARAFFDCVKGKIEE